MTAAADPRPSSCLLSEVSGRAGTRVSIIFCCGIAGIGP